MLFDIISVQIKHILKLYKISKKDVFGRFGKLVILMIFMSDIKFKAKQMNKTLDFVGIAKLSTCKKNKLSAISLNKVDALFFSILIVLFMGSCSLQ